MTEYEQNIEIMKDLRSRIDQVLADQPSRSFNIPDPLKHKYVSFVKSGFRIAAGACLMAGFFWYAGFLLIFAEMLGILEEIV